MGNCCGAEEEKSPLLGSGPVGARTGSLLTTPTSNYVTEQPQGPQSQAQSARQHASLVRKDFETSIEQISRVDLKPIPIPEVNKTLQDCGKLYNEMVNNFNSLEAEIHRFKEYFVAETAGIPDLDSCVRLLKERCGEAKLSVERKTKYSIEVKYDTNEVTACCTGKPERVLVPLEHFNKSCIYIRDILAHAPEIQKNASILLNDDEKLRKDIIKRDLPLEESQIATKNFLDNVSKLRVIAAGTDTVKRDVEKKFQKVSRACEGFFDDSEADD